jgi:hypothetical protein
MRTIQELSKVSTSRQFRSIWRGKIERWWDWAAIWLMQWRSATTVTRLAASFSQYDFDGCKLFSGFSIHERTFYSNYRYIGPPKEALATIRQALGHAELDKPRPDSADP